MKIIQEPSPNFDKRPDDIDINVLVMHYTGMPTAHDAMERMCDAKAEVSAHYMVDEDGTVYQLVDEAMRAWHAGIGAWRGRASLNDTSIGIEIVNPGHEFGYRHFPDEQMQSVIELSQKIVSRHPIDARNVIGHSDLAPNRKEDPGELFNWKLLAKHGVGLWPKVKTLLRPHRAILNPGDESIAVAEVQRMLADYGYHIRVDGHYGEKTEVVVKAFKRHFVPENVSVIWDNMSDDRLQELLSLVTD